MRQESMLSAGYYSLNDDIKINLPSKKIKWFTRYHAYVPKIGDFTTNIFNFSKIKEVSSLLLLAILGVSELPSSLTQFCLAVAIYLVINSFINDVLLYIPAEKAIEIENHIMGNHELVVIPTQEYQVNSRWPRVNSVFRFACYGAVYTSFAILSANSAVGALEVMPNLLIAKIFGAIMALLQTELGIFYYHMIFYPYIQQFFKSSNNQSQNLTLILIAQFIKNFMIISVYYTSNGIFYLDSLVEQLDEAFSLTINQTVLLSAMMISGGLVFLNTLVIRMESTFKKLIEKYTNGISKKEKMMEFFLELIMSASGLAMSIRRLPTSLIISGIGGLVSIISLGIGWYSIYLYPTTQPSDSESKSSPLTTELSKPCIDKICHYFQKVLKFIFSSDSLNGHSRFMKSTFLTFAAIDRVDRLFKRHHLIDTGLDITDKLYLTAIIGIYIGLNNSVLYKKSIDTHIKYLYKKWEISSEKKSGFLSSLFKAAEEFENPRDKFALLRVLNPESTSRVFV